MSGEGYMRVVRETRVVYSPPAMNVLGWIRNRPLGQVIAGAAVLAALGAAITYLGTARRVTLAAGGVERTIYTHAATVGGALQSAGETVTSSDFLQPAADTPLRQVDRIEYRRAGHDPRPVSRRHGVGDHSGIDAGRYPGRRRLAKLPIRPGVGRWVSHLRSNAALSSPRRYGCGLIAAGH